MRSRRSFLRDTVLCVGLVVLAQLVVADSFKCRFSVQGATYDLSSLVTAQSEGYALDDNTEGSNKSYLFNICEVVDKPLAACQDATSVAYRYSVGGNPQCISLGSSTLDESTAKFELVDADDAAKGVRLTYTGGSQCDAKPDTTYSFRINFLCGEEPDSYEPRVTQIGDCEFQLQFKSYEGCPVQCKVKDGYMCSDKGVCAFDKDSKTSRCFCYSGRYGDACELDQPEKAGGSSCDLMCRVLSVVCICIALVIIAAGVVYHRLRRLENTSAHFEPAVDYEPDGLRSNTPYADASINGGANSQRSTAAASSLY